MYYIKVNKTNIGIIFGLLIMISLQNVYAINYVDSTGYTPNWAKPLGYHEALSRCSGITGDITKDGNWCFEWVAYVLDQGIENFPDSTLDKTSSSTTKQQDIPLTAGKTYEGNLKNFLPMDYSFGEDWKVGTPFVIDDFKNAFSKSDGLVDLVIQQILINDIFDSSTQLHISLSIMEFENKQKSEEFFKKSKISIENNVILAFGSNAEKREKSSKFSFADCYGYTKNYAQDEEQSQLLCIKDKYIITTLSTENKGLVTDHCDYVLTDEVTLNFAEIIINRIDSFLNPNPNILFPDEAHDLVVQNIINKQNRNCGNLLDDEELAVLNTKRQTEDAKFQEKFQSLIDEGRIKIPTNDIAIKHTPQPLDLDTPSMDTFAIKNWGLGLMTDNSFAEHLKSMIENGYFTIEGLESQLPIVEEINKKPDSQDLNIESKAENIEDVNIGPIIIGLIIIFVITGIIIFLIIRNIKQRKKMQTYSRISRKLILCSSCGKEIEGNYCSNCGQHEPDFNKLVKSSIMQKRSNLWYILPIFLGIVGGVIAYFILRKSDSSKARNCILIGTGMGIIGIVIGAASI